MAGLCCASPSRTGRADWDGWSGCDERCGGDAAGVQRFPARGVVDGSHFDSQVRGARAEPLPEPVLASIADYYRPRDDNIASDEPPDRGGDGDAARRVGVSRDPKPRSGVAHRRVGCPRGCADPARQPERCRTRYASAVEQRGATNSRGSRDRSTAITSSASSACLRFSCFWLVAVW